MKKRNFEEAKTRAELMLRDRVKFIEIPDDINILDDQFIQGDGFWIFFMNKNITLHPEDWFLKQFSAYIVGETGGGGYMRDLRKNPIELQKALDGLAIAYRSNTDK
ncbi:Hemolysin [Granulibacter bethesdensis]|uniref:Hemolysin n=1 Tax=Granulibacter bethesdensis TaxID=364410 RepID=A0AAC9KBT7_9PROT|nr:hypothetical protein [Granulibacter bethesdensis]APH55059.1 Hemolysin [Granulibacter bethesdensis]APH62645.1 Hemolysin [Granulibacter bethesdensis]